jgi:dipeptidyl aminopeptidase/acylaminoacyl peptidase
MRKWEQRLRTPISFFPDWSAQAPDRCVYASNESGVWQVHAWNVATGARRRVTDNPVGITEGLSTFDGDGVLWFEDVTGDEAGQWLVQPFGGGETRPFLDGVPHGWGGGLTQAPGIVVAGISDRDGFAVHVSLDGGAARELHRSQEYVQVGNRGLSADGTLLCLEHAEHGDLIHPALRVVDPRSGETIGEQEDRGMSLYASCWSPVPGDARLAIEHERAGETRPAIWDLSTGERHDLRIELEGEISVEDWWPDGSALLLKQLSVGQHRLFRFTLASGEVEPLGPASGMVWTARVRPDGNVWLLHEQGDRPRRLIDQDGREVLPLPQDSCPPSRAYESWHFENPQGQRVHGFLVTPDSSGGPFPVLMFVHGGPTALDMDRWQPEVQAYVDAGFIVGLVNYRGSVGYGREWRDSLLGDIGGPDLEDVVAGFRDLVARGLGDPDRAVVGGHSWGGYITLLALGKHPDLWTCGIAGVPVGDYAAGYEDLSPLLQAYDRALLGGAPSEVPELMRDRSPINFADDVRAPVLFVIGKNDSRCPYRQAMLYVDKLAARGHPHEVYVFETGHGAFDVDERVRQLERILAFLEQNVPATFSR